MSQKRVLKLDEIKACIKDLQDAREMIRIAERAEYRARTRLKESVIRQLPNLTYELHVEHGYITLQSSIPELLEGMDGSGIYYFANYARIWPSGGVMLVVISIPVNEPLSLMDLIQYPEFLDDVVETCKGFGIPRSAIRVGKKLRITLPKW